MHHRNAPLTPAGRLRLIERCQHRPIAHVAVEAGISRQCLSTWVARYRRLGEEGLFDASSAPKTSPAQTTPQVIARIEELRREKKLSARAIVIELAAEGTQVSESAVARWLRKLGISRRRDLDPSGSSHRKPAGKIVARYSGHMIHVDVKKTGRIPDGGGWRAHGKGSAQQRIRPFTPRHSGKVERYNRILAEEFLYARVWTSEPQRAQAIGTWLTHYNYHRAHTAAGNQPPASRLHTGVTNVMTGNT